MPERNIPRYCVILTALFVAATLAGFYAPIPGKRELLGDLMASFGPFLELSPWRMFFLVAFPLFVFAALIETILIFILG